MKVGRGWGFRGGWLWSESLRRRDGQVGGSFGEISNGVYLTKAGRCS